MITVISLLTLPEMDGESLLTWTLIILVALIVWYCVNWYRIGSKLLTTKLASGNGAGQADHYYYLPSAELKLEVVATVQLRIANAEDRLLSAALVQMKCSAETAIVPDTSNLLLLHYTPDVFSTDEIKIKTNPFGLIEDIAVQTEDRIEAIVQIGTRSPGTSAVRKDMDAFQPKGPSKDLVVRNVEFRRAFLISSDEVYKDKIGRSWKISLEGTSNHAIAVDASFELINPHPIQRLAIEPGTDHPGILTRPLKSVRWHVKAHSVSGEEPESQEVQMECLLPDISRTITVPVKRKRFIKNTGMPKFSNGMLVENYIHKPSEVEGFISIPLKILKAIFSIPSQLLHFRITRNQELADFQKSLKELQDAQAETLMQQQKAQNKKLDDKVDDFQNTLNEFRLRFDNAVREVGQKGDLPKLGKLQPNERSIRDEIARARNERSAGLAVKAARDFLPPVKDPADWSVHFQGSWQDYQNSRFMTCVPAAAAHLIISWCSASKSQLSIPSDSDVLSAYKAVSRFQETNPQSDKGCSMYRFMKHWRDNGLGGQHINTFVPMRIGNVELLKTAVYWFGGCMIGLKMPASAQGQESWEVNQTDVSGSPGSWGGHAVPVIGYDATNFIVISWGKKILMTHEFYKTYNDEAYVALSDRHWTGNSDETPTEPTRTFAQLNQALTEILRS